MRGLPDNNADGAEGTIPYKYLDFCRSISLKYAVRLSSNSWSSEQIYVINSLILYRLYSESISKGSSFESILSFN